jgi:hypothetical protein
MYSVFLIFSDRRVRQSTRIGGARRKLHRETVKRPNLSVQIERPLDAISAGAMLSLRIKIEAYKKCGKQWG